MTLIFCAFFFLNTEAHRVLYYICLPVFIFYLFSAKAYFQVLARSHLLLVLAALSFYAIVSIFWSGESNADSIFRVIKSVFFLSVYSMTIIFLLLENKGFFAKYLDIFLHVAAIAAVAMFLYDYIYPDNAWRLQGLGRVENSVLCAIVYGLCLIFLLYRPGGTLFSGKKHRCLLIFLYATLYLIVLVLTYSRGPLLAFCATILVSLAFHRKWSILVPIVLAGLTLAVLQFTTDGLLPASYARGDSHRFDIWRQGYDIWMQHFWIGTGFASEYTFRIPGYKLEEWSSTHNLALGTAMYGGVIGLGLLLCAAALSAKIAWQQVRMKHFFPALWLIYILIISQFQFHSLFTNLSVEWLALWTAMAYFCFLEIQAKTGSKPL